MATAYLESTDASDIVGVEVYGHAEEIPVEYHGPEAQCGVVAVWLAH